jgi:hypothetical protein
MFAVLALALLSATAFATTINSTTVSGNQLTIGGVGFNGSPTVTLNGKMLTIVSSTSTQIVATINPVPPTGSYRLTVKSGKASAFAYVTVPSSPAIVAQATFVNQSQQVVGTFTPTTDGIFRISYYADSPDTSADWAFAFQWTDEVGVREIIDPSMAYLSSNFVERVHVVRSLAGQPLTYSSSGPGPAPYSWYITIEQLQ